MSVKCFKRVLLVFVSILAYCASSCQGIEEPKTWYDSSLSLQQNCFRGDNSFMDELKYYGRLCLDSLCCRTFQGRRIGTKGWELSYNFLISELKEMGYSPQIQSFQTENGTLIRNIIVIFPGIIDSTIVVGAHFDGAQQSIGKTHYPAANDNGSGTVAQLMLLKDLTRNGFTTQRTVKICFWGCEEVFDGQAFRGSKYFTQLLTKEDLSTLQLYINIDTVGHQLVENMVLLNHSGEKRVEATAYRTQAFGRFDYAVSKRVTNLVSDYKSFFDIHIPYLNYHDYCIDCKNKLHTPDDTPDAVSIERLYRIILDVRDNIETY